MSLWKIAWRSLRQRALASTLTGLSMALGVALVVTVLVIHGVVERQFSGDAQGYHLIVGAKGGKLQLVLNTVYHLSQPIENIPYSFYKEFTEGQFAQWTTVAVPYCLGDSYRTADRAFRVVGTTPDMFDKLVYGRDEQGDKRYEFSEGRNFHADAFFEAVIGSVVARQAGLKVGDPFNPTHGISDESEGHQHDAFTVVGVLEPTGTANDRALFVNLEGFYLLDGHAKAAPEVEEHDDGDAHEDAHDHDAHDNDQDAHDHDAHDNDHDAHEHDAHDNDHDAHEHDAHDHNEAEGHRHIEPLPRSQCEVTAILLVLGNDLYAETIRRVVNEGQIAQAVFPAQEVMILLDTLVAPIQLILLVLTVMIVVVASISILVGIYNSMSERSRDIAVMRALGASRSAVMTVILMESVLLALCGGVAGILLGHGLVGLANPLVVARTGIELSVTQFDIKELVLIPGLIILASVVGLLPAVTAYRTDVAKSLSANP